MQFNDEGKTVVRAQLIKASTVDTYRETEWAEGTPGTWRKKATKGTRVKIGEEKIRIIVYITDGCSHNLEYKTREKAEKDMKALSDKIA